MNYQGKNLVAQLPSTNHFNGLQRQKRTEDIAKSNSKPVNKQGIARNNDFLGIVALGIPMSLVLEEFLVPTSPERQLAPTRISSTFFLPPYCPWFVNLIYDNPDQKNTESAFLDKNRTLL
jgi:hypothetical protein